MRVVVHFKTSEERSKEKKKIQKVQKKKKKNKKLQHIVFPCGPPP